MAVVCVGVSKTREEETSMAGARRERRNETIQVKVTTEERQLLERRAARAKVSLSEAGRQAILRDLRGGMTNIVERDGPSRSEGDSPA